MKLKDYLSRTGRKQSDIAAAAGCSQAHISQICKFGRRPSPDVAARISEATGGEVSVLDLLYPNHRTMAGAIIGGHDMPEPDGESLTAECLDDLPAVVAYHNVIRDRGSSPEEVDLAMEKAIAELQQNRTLKYRLERWGG